MIGRPRVVRILRIGLVTLVVLYGMVLRFDALSLKYGAVDRPAWLHALQQSRAHRSLLRPDRVSWAPVTLVPHRDGTWTKYGSDPYTYLQYAREMRSFYAAHRREPLFPFVTKVFLRLLHQQDVAVSFASAAFSVLAVVATFLLGAYAFSYWVGLGAALALVVEYDVVSWGVDGWRDDAFACAVVLFALAMLRYARAPSSRSGIAVGIVGGLACLTRITSLSFVVPGMIWLYVTGCRPRKARLRELGLGAAVTAALVAPFIVNCWLVFGDPLYAINVHADIYRAAEGQSIQVSQTATEYLTSELRSRPVRTIDTVALGMTSYPFLNKWHGFDPWDPRLGRALAWAAVVGLVLFVGCGPGRLLLLVLAASLVPYAATWRLISDWRFTEHAYPFFLIAAGYGLWRIADLGRPSRLRTRARSKPVLGQLVFWGSVLSVLGAGTWIVTRVLPVLTVWESLRAHEAVTVSAGGRDASFFPAGWSTPVTEGNVTARRSQGAASVIRLLMPRLQGCDLTLRLDPFPRPPDGTTAGLPAVSVFVNEHPVGTIELMWNPARVGSYTIHLSGKVHRGRACTDHADDSAIVERRDRDPFVVRSRHTGPCVAPRGTRLEDRTGPAARAAHREGRCP